MKRIAVSSRRTHRVWLPLLALAAMACSGTPAPPPTPPPAAPTQTVPEPLPPPPAPVAEPEAGRVDLSTAFLVGGEMPTGERDRITDLVVASIKAGTPLFRRCYAKALSRNASMRGEVDIEFILKSDGTLGVLRAGKGNVSDPQLIECTLQAFQQLALPRPPADYSMIAPMQFRPE